MKKILIIDDEERIRASLNDSLILEGYSVKTAENIKEAKKLLFNEIFDAVLLDLWLPDGDGIEILREVSEDNLSPEIIVMSGHGNIEKAVEATKLGAFDFIEKPLRLDRVLVALKNSIKYRDKNIENREIKQQHQYENNIIGDSDEINRVLELVDKVAPTEGRVFITGENGTGKELIARLIHDKSLRRQGPFIKVNCAAIPSELIESELFGYEKGAFTGASGSKYGKFELADGGTIFLDEIGDMDISVQAKVLRVLQEGEFDRVGGVNTIRVNVRVIAATNRDVETEIREKRFREDLYYRLNVVPVHIPPLRDRKEDIPLLTDYFLNVYSKKNNKTIKNIEPDAVNFLINLKWSGNIRELQNVIERLVILTHDDTITKEDIENIFGYHKNGTVKYSGEKLKDIMEEYEKKIITAALKYCKENVAKTAEVLGLERSSLYKKIDRLGLKD